MELIDRELKHIPNPKARATAEENLRKIGEGQRDFRF